MVSEGLMLRLGGELDRGRGWKGVGWDWRASAGRFGFGGFELGGRLGLVFLYLPLGALAKLGA